MSLYDLRKERREDENCEAAKGARERSKLISEEECRAMETAKALDWLRGCDLDDDYDGNSDIEFSSPTFGCCVDALMPVTLTSGGTGALDWLRGTTPMPSRSLSRSSWQPKSKQNGQANDEQFYSPKASKEDISRFDGQFEIDVTMIPEILDAAIVLDCFPLASNQGRTRLLTSSMPLAEVAHCPFQIRNSML